MIIEDLSKYTLYAHADGNSVETVMNSDNEGHGRARDEGYSEVSEVDYWLIRLKQDREERDRKAIEEAILEAKAGLAAEVL